MSRLYNDKKLVLPLMVIALASVGVAGYRVVSKVTEPINAPTESEAVEDRLSHAAERMAQLAESAPPLTLSRRNPFTHPALFEGTGRPVGGSPTSYPGAVPPLSPPPDWLSGIEDDPGWSPEFEAPEGSDQPPDTYGPAPPPIQPPFTVMSIVSGDTGRCAALRSWEGGIVLVSEGDTLPGGWQVASMTGSEVVLADGESSYVLSLRVREAE